MTESREKIDTDQYRQNRNTTKDAEGTGEREKKTIINERKKEEEDYRGRKR